MAVTRKAPTSDPDRVWLERVLCAVFDSRTDEETVRQACTLAAGGSVDIVTVDHSRGAGTMISAERAERAMHHAWRVAEEMGVPSTTELVTDEDRWRGVGARVAGHDVLVVAGYTRSRAEGILANSVGTKAVHESPIPVLLARPSPASFPSDILLPTDGSSESLRAARYAATIAARASAAVTVLAVGLPGGRGPGRETAEETAEILRRAGVEPAIAVEDGPAGPVIVDFAAQRTSSSLIVVGGGRRIGPGALGSVSEHVANHAHCSVLVARR
jgi:nucleotide-binding universal stress UspA family protein